MVRNGSSVEMLLTIALFVAVVLTCAIFYIPIAIVKLILGDRAG
jgi:hypothetical protein